MPSIKSLGRLASVIAVCAVSQPALCAVEVEAGANETTAASEVNSQGVVLESQTELKTPAGSLRVQQFQLKNFTPYPQLGWTQAWVSDYLADIIKNQGPFFTPDELYQVARGLSVEMKKAGLMFSRAVISEQKVIDGIIEIIVEPGVLGEVVVLNAQRTKPETLARPFIEHLQKPALRPDLDQALMQVDYLPGLDVFGFFSVTGTPGVSRLNLKVIEERAWTAKIGADSYGNEATGKERASANLKLLNPTGLGDTFSLGVSRSFEYPGTFDGFVGYSIPLGADYQPLAFNFSSSDFDLGTGFEELKIFGQALTLGAQYTHEITNWPVRYQLTTGVQLQKSKIDSEFFSDIFQRETQVASVNVGGSRHKRINKNLAQSGRLNFVAGQAKETTPIPGSATQTRDADETFVIAQAGYNFERLTDLTTMPRSTALDVQVFYSPDRLPAIQQMSLAGAQGVRSLESGFFSVDQGVLLAYEYQTPLIQSIPYIKPFVFADLGYGIRLNNGQTEDQTGQFIGVGLGFTGSKGRLSYRYEFGQTVQLDFSGGDLSIDALNALNNDKPSNHTFSISYQLREYQ